MDLITSLGFGCSFFPLTVFVVVVEGEGRGGVFVGVGVGPVSSSSSSNSVISLLALSFFNNDNKQYLSYYYSMASDEWEKIDEKMRERREETNDLLILSLFRYSLFKIFKNSRGRETLSLPSFFEGDLRA